VLTPSSRVELDPVRGARPPVVSLSDEFKLLGDFDARFPAGPPSLLQCRSLRVSGDVSFGAAVVCQGDVVVEGPGRIPDGAVLQGDE